MNKPKKNRSSFIVRTIPLFIAVVSLQGVAPGEEYHVGMTGDDANPGNLAKPLRTIQRAAELAQSGDGVTVHAGVYRERINPPRGGESDMQRIIYQAAQGDKVRITGSESIKNWEKVRDDTWKVTLPNTFFGNFNPYNDLIKGDWFEAKRRQHHTGAVYLNGDWLVEAATLEAVLKPAGGVPLWFGQVDKDSTTLWAQFKGVNPNETEVEINVRQTVFTPEKTGINYITVRGFDLRNAATPWAPPTAKQIGIVSALWCKGWIIENNEICYAKCGGVTLGKYGDEWDNRAATAEGYVGTVNRALANGWNKATVGSHVVRNNHIHHCDQAGVVGSLGCAFSSVTDNVIHDIHTSDLFGGAEMGGIKFHGAIDVVISHNHIYRCGNVSAIWLDWMGQGAQITRNLLHDNTGWAGDLFLEMQHGPLLVANNIFLSTSRIYINAKGGAFVHNLVASPFDQERYDARDTPFHKAHSTEIAGMHKSTNGDQRFYNNVFAGPANMTELDNSMLPCFAAGNVFAKGSKPSKYEVEALLKPDFDGQVKLAQKADGWYLTIAQEAGWRNEVRRKLVTTDLLGKAQVSACAYENADASPLCVDTDYFGGKRDNTNPFPGPFETPGNGEVSVKVW